jgi:crotonobetainyl-CoA:carnitine CoA-transferase CaiB-like acyl-CoA transferase
MNEPAPKDKTTTSHGRGALSGITVLDLSRLLPGPYCSMILADHGARVIAIEDRRFLRDDFFVTTVNRNKEHMTLNLKAAEGRAIFLRMAEGADVILEGFRPGVVQRLGVDYETVQRINAGIVYCSITGYGQSGPLSSLPGHDVNYLAHAGVLDLIGEPDRPPAIPGIQIADLVGGLNAAVGILLALAARRSSGRGQYVDIAMTDAVVGLLPLPLYLMQGGQGPLQRGQWLLSHRYACYNTYETLDGRYLSIGAVENRFWKNLCTFLGVPQYAPLQHDEHQREEIIAFMRDTFRRKTLAEWEKRLSGVQTCWAPVRTMAEVLRDPLFRQRGMVEEIAGDDEEPQTQLGTPIKLSRTPGAVRTRPVAFGENTRAVLMELGYDNSDIRRFEEQGAI